ncbi:hypothetical protein ACHAW6_004458 [Cyclotella cf. meneghiniana]
MKPQSTAISIPLEPLHQRSTTEDKNTTQHHNQITIISQFSLNMPKKSKKQTLRSGIHMAAKRFDRRMQHDAFRSMANFDSLTLQQQKEAIRNALIDMGTNVAQNDADPTGNGDQTLIESSEHRDIARELYAIGGDIHAHFITNSLSPFAMNCVLGLADNVHKTLKDLTQVESQPFAKSESLLVLLETRETSLRLSPLLFIVSAGKNLASSPETKKHQDTAKILLKYGANPLAKDVLGKTVCHYGAGAMANQMTLDVVDMCISAAKSHFLYGRDIELHGLKTAEMNGKMGVAGGFDCDSGRRSVLLKEEKREVWIKPENIRLLDANETQPTSVSLPDIQDRFGSVSLHEVVMRDRSDVASFLLQKHHTSIHSTDADGISPVGMASGHGQSAWPNVAPLIMEAARKEASQSRKAKKQSESTCENCQVIVTGKLQQCSRCKSVVYCGRDCQVAHWKNHKIVCKDLAALSMGINLGLGSGLKDVGMHHSTFSFSKNKQLSGTYQNPKGVEVGEKFVVKVQGNTMMSPLLIYDKTRTCEFSLYPDEPGFSQILGEVQKEKAWQGRKTFMKASFDDKGCCTIYPDTAGVKDKYSW